MKVKTETLPSEEAQAKTGPSSCGAHAIALTAEEHTLSISDSLDPRSRPVLLRRLTASGVKQVLLDLAPAFLRSLVLLPNEDLAVERARGENRAERGMSPRESVNRSVVADWPAQKAVSMQ